MIQGVLLAVALSATQVTLSRPAYRWLWGGFGFHNSEATMTPMMDREFREERVVKTFREISPTFARLFAGYADWTKEAMDSFADYYDETFRKAGTTLYVVPGRMPYMPPDFDIRAYAEKVAANLEYLIRERKCVKIRYYCLANELSSGSVYCWFGKDGRLELFKRYQEELYMAFRRHGLDIALMATDSSGLENIPHLEWAAQNMDEITDTYCWHFYADPRKYAPGDPGLYRTMTDALTNLVALASRKEKRLCLGEFGMTGTRDATSWRVMINDTSYSADFPAEESSGALARAEMGLAALNAGCVSAVSWTMVDYPNPFLREDGDTPEEKGRYEVSRFSGHGLQVRYNKNGLFRWDDDVRDYSARADLYTMGWLVKLFRKGSRVLPAACADETLRVGAIENPDGSVSIAVINWGMDKDVEVTSAAPIRKPLRVYAFDAANPPQNAFNDLQPPSGTILAASDGFRIQMPAKSMRILTTDYVARIPAPVEDLRVADGRVSWTANADPDHAYYRVYRDGIQIASTVATSCRTKGGANGTYSVKSVDRWGNVGR